MSPRGAGDHRPACCNSLHPHGPGRTRGRRQHPIWASGKNPFPLGQGQPVTLTWRNFEKSQRLGHWPESTTSEPRDAGGSGGGGLASAFIKSRCDSLSSWWGGSWRLQWAPPHGNYPGPQHVPARDSWANKQTTIPAGPGSTTKLGMQSQTACLSRHNRFNCRASARARVADCCCTPIRFTKIQLFALATGLQRGQRGISNRGQTWLGEMGPWGEDTSRCRHTGPVSLGTGEGRRAAAEGPLWSRGL